MFDNSLFPARAMHEISKEPVQNGKNVTVLNEVNVNKRFFFSINFWLYIETYKGRINGVYKKERINGI